jgi:CheY-like chemotaxis protein
VKHVLVVEDDAHNAVLFRKLLERRVGCRVTVSEAADEILALVFGGDVDLVIMDVSLAHTRHAGRPVSGVDLTQMIKSDARGVGVPIMLATAHAMRGDAEKLLAESGADDYVSKPITDHATFVQQVLGLLEEAA